MIVAASYSMQQLYQQCSSKWTGGSNVLTCRISHSSTMIVLEEEVVLVIVIVVLVLASSSPTIMIGCIELIIIILPSSGSGYRLTLTTSYQKIKLHDYYLYNQFYLDYICSYMYINSLRVICAISKLVHISSHLPLV